MKILLLSFTMFFVFLGGSFGNNPNESILYSNNKFFDKIIKSNFSFRNSNFSDSIKNEINVKAFGALGDGIHDDTKSIQNCIQSLNNGGTIFFPKGKYKITQTIEINPYVFLKGGDFIAERDYDKNTSFMVYTGKNNENIPAFRLHFSSGMSGFTIYYPEQVTQQKSTPIPYGFTLETNKSKFQNMDNITLENIMLLNSYKGIKLENAGRFNISNIYGNPIKVGLFIDKVLDVSRAKHIHFWPFTYPVGTPMFDWIIKNGIAYNLNYIDQFNGYDLFAFGYNYGFKIGKGFWGDLTSCLADQCRRPIYLDDVNIVKIIGGSFINNGISFPNVTTSSNLNGSVDFIGTSFYGGASVASLITSDTGKISFTSCDFKEQADWIDGWKWSPLIVSGNAQVNLNNSKSINKRNILGTSNLNVDNTKWFSKDEDISPENFNMFNWKDNLPLGWKIYTHNNIEKISNGIKLKLEPNKDHSNSVNFIDFPITEDIKQSGDMLLFELDYDVKINNSSTFRFFIKICDPTGSKQAISVGTDFGLISQDKIKLRIPMYLGKLSYNPVLRIEWQAYDNISGFINLTNLKLYKSLISKLTNHQIESLLKDIYLDPEDNGIVTYKENKSKVLYKNNTPPSEGYWDKGDKVYSSNPEQTKYIGWICIMSGKPGIWKGFGAIEN